MEGATMKKALLVGINRYPDPGNELKGCVNDVRQMAETLKTRYGFPADGDMRFLTDARATTKAILDGLAWLTAGASPGDSLVFHYSGHGSQVPDRNGDETTDRLDEILCPYDLDWDHPLTDDDLAAACDDIPQGALLTVILDCCHSGTGLRDVAHDRRRFLPHPETHRNGLNLYRRPRRQNPGLPCLPRHLDLDIHGRRFGVSVTRANAVLIAACRDDQTSADAWIDGGYHGAHTYHLCRTLANGTRDLTYRALVSATGTALARAGFDQVPQLEGPAKLLALPFSAA